MSDPLRKALEAIEECRSAYSRDPEERALNAVEFCRDTARKALALEAQPTPPPPDRYPDCWGQHDCPSCGKVREADHE
jgi:hypothetical protein